MPRKFSVGDRVRFHHERTVSVVTIAPKPRRPQPMLTSTLQPAASAPMVGRFIGFVEQMKVARPARGTRVDRKIGDRPSLIDPEGQINPNESATAKRPEIAAASIKS